ncbi:hypothetical protein [Peptoniphilus indolicus]|uniref:Uncharacterized protein n=2 Tax=Peptoniphilus indolicus TaxID=33030 RepID=G4D5F5_9FIRM|nr:hypothetical protein [Peptoniphilus indolicus]EGY79001.1 hypothetical protein HMPREF9129_1635 [Peptoniphilus indolicus ATCC 29427]SUB74373.1 Uncharacterised protein [Peptoniphilus indolicus]
MNNFNLRSYYALKKDEENNKFLDKNRQQFLGEELKLVFWYDNIAEFGDVKKETIVANNKDGTQLVRHERFDGNVFQQGTFVNAENLGRMEWNDIINFVNVKHLAEIVNRLDIQVATLLGQSSNNMSYNGFVASAANINTDIIILEGWYDEVNGRGVI